MISTLPAPLAAAVRSTLISLLIAGSVAAQAANEDAPSGFVPQVIADWFNGIQLVPWLAGAVVFIVVFSLVAQKLRLRRREMRRQITGLPNGARFRVVDAMVHCVWHARKIDKERLKRALELARNTTNMDYTLEHIREAAMRADRIIIPTNFMYLADGLTHAEKMVVFNSSVSVLLADGPLTMADRKLLKVLARGMRLRHRDLSYLGRLIPD